MHIHDEDNDDAPIGHVLSRREIIKVLAGAGAALFVGYGANKAGASGLPGISSTSATTGSAGSLAGALNRVALPACIVRPEQTEGPYFVDEELNRSDIRIDTITGQQSPGVRLDLNFLVSQINGGCAPYPNVMVDVWHCDALGVYSEFGSGAGHNFLRGFQMTDANGSASFITIYPGWYTGRTVHIHFKIRTDPGDPNGYDFTAQLYFDDLLTDQIFANNAPYNSRGPRTTRNANDGIYQQGGSQLMLTCVPNGTGYTATFDIGLVVTGGTPIPTATATAPVVATSTATATATNTPTSAPSNTPNPSVTNTPQPTSTRTPTTGPTNTPSASNTPGATSTAGATNTPVPTSTATGVPSATATPCNITFSDVNSGDYFYEAVTYLSCNGVISGYPDNTFRPYNSASRAQFMKIVVLSQGWKLVNPLIPSFSDIPYGSTFYQYIETAKARGIIDGYSDGTFRPGENVSRGQVCKIVALARAWKLINPFVATFNDVPKGSTFFQHIETAVQKGVINGYGNGSFGPGNPATRGQIAKIIYLSLGTAGRRR